MRPIHEMLLRAQGHARFHMPGHKGALDPFDEFAALVIDAMAYQICKSIGAMFAVLEGRVNAILLTGGATAGNLTMLLYASTRYRAIRMERTAHVSAVSGLVLGDMEVGESGAVFATRPDYFGRAGALPKADLLLVDEAHGAHFNWWDSPPNAGRLGAARALFEAAAHTAVIDHHGTNPGYAQVCRVEPELGATGTLVREILRDGGWQVDAGTLDELVRQIMRRLNV